MPSPVVLVHGLRGSAADWELQRSFLEERGHHVSTPDLPGLGKRDGESFSIGESIATIADAVSRHDEPALVVGIGVGAHLAIDYAALTAKVGEDPLALVALGCGIRPLGWLLDSYRIASASHRMLPDRGAAISESVADVFLRAGSVTSQTTRVAGVFDDTLRQLHVLDTTSALASVEAPVWLVNGQFDRFRLQERAFLAATRRGQLIRLSGARLAAGVVRPDAINRILLSILDGSRNAA